MYYNSIINCDPIPRRSNWYDGGDAAALCDGVFLNQQGLISISLSAVSGAVLSLLLLFRVQWHVEPNKQSRSTKQYGHGLWYMR